MKQECEAVESKNSIYQHQHYSTLPSSLTRQSAVVDRPFSVAAVRDWNVFRRAMKMLPFKNLLQMTGHDSADSYGTAIHVSLAVDL